LPLPEAVLALLVIGVGVYLRVVDVAYLHGGQLSQDEVAISRIYVSGIVALDPVPFNGASYLTHAVLLDLWYRAFGFGPYASRYFTMALGFVGLVAFALALRRLLGARVALWATALLAVATYAVYFSLFATETISVLLFLPLVTLLFVRFVERSSLLRSLAFGLTLGASLFTYPGLLVGYAGIGAGWALAEAAELVRGRRGAATPVLGRVSAVGWAGAALGAGGVLAVGLALQHWVYGQGGVLFRGGGGFSFGPAAYLASLRVLLGDLFVATTTWNLPHWQIPFFEWTFWPLALLGAWEVWRRHPLPVVRGAILSVVLVVLALPFTGQYPGMRRGIYLLLPLCALGGVGARLALDRLGAVFGGLLVASLIGHSLAYQLTLGRHTTFASNFGDHFGGRPVPDAVLLRELATAEVVLSRAEYEHPWDWGRHVAFVHLARRYGLLPEGGHGVTVLESNDPMPQRVLLERDDAVLVTWRPDLVLSLMARPQRLCFRTLREVVSDEPAVLRLVRPEEASVQDECPWTRGRPEAVMTPCVHLGARFVDSRLVHEVECTNASCGSDRPDVAWAHPGWLTFKLPPPQGEGGRVVLALKVLYSGVEQRANLVLVNDHPTSVLDASRLVERSLAVLDVPLVAVAPGTAPWSVRLGPSGVADRVGWDVFWAAFVRVPEGEAVEPVVERQTTQACATVQATSP
jgi:hypothetical protein